MHDFLSGQLSSINLYRSLMWEVNFVLFNSMLKYVINRLMHAFFHFRTYHHSTDIYPSGRYRSLWMITVLIWERHALIYNYSLSKRSISIFMNLRNQYWNNLGSWTHIEWYKWLSSFYYILVRNIYDMDVNEYERLSNITLQT